MKYIQERFARDLFESLTKTLKSTETQITIGGEGVHWHCLSERNDSQCKIHCHKNEYFTYYSRYFTQVATSRISSKSDTIAAVHDWLEGDSLPNFYDKYSFIDYEKRILSQLQNDLLKSSTPLSNVAKSDLEQKWGDSYELLFWNQQRSAKIQHLSENASSYLGLKSGLYTEFMWDQCKLFEFHPENSQDLIPLLTKWVCEEEMPSKIRHQFPYLEIGELADYYERGEGIIGEFLQSWDKVEEFYRDIFANEPVSEQALSFIQELRNAGYDQHFRAGQSLASLGLSRSRRHGLRQNQPSIWFNFNDFQNGTMIINANFVSIDSPKYPIKLTDKVKKLLDSLVKIEIT